MQYQFHIDKQEPASHPGFEMQMLYFLTKAGSIFNNKITKTTESANILIYEATRRSQYESQNLRWQQQRDSETLAEIAGYGREKK